MDARARTVRDIFDSNDQYVIPFFQRFYSWERKHWKKLLDDVLALLDSKLDSQHFLGPLVCTPLPHLPGEVSAFQLIDGQQRLATLTIMLAALRRIGAEQQNKDFVEEITEDYLTHKRKEGLQRYKIIPRIGDREALLAIINQIDLVPHRHLSIVKAYEFFVKAFKKLPDAQVQPLKTAITSCLSLVVITISEENPYEIFESLNSTGLPLQQSDLIRNFLFMHVPLKDQEAFFETEWQPFEAVFEETESHKTISQTSFYRNYLMKAGEFTKANEVFVDFKARFFESGHDPVGEMQDLRTCARNQSLISRPDTCGIPRLRDALLEVVDLETTHPLLLALLERFDHEELSLDDLIQCIADLSSFVVRRAVCGESTRLYNRWFPDAIRAVEDSPVQNLRECWLRRGWPSDSTFQECLLRFPLYKKDHHRCRMILDRLEASYGHKETVDPSTLTIEHVMPQTIDSTEHGLAWQDMLGDNWYVAHQEWIHTVGNLTLSGYNPDLSNQSYSKKKTLLAHSNLLLNRIFADLDTWNADEIRNRGQRLAKEVCRLWPSPEVASPSDNRPPPKPKVSFDIDGLRRLTIERLDQAFEWKLEQKSEARYVDANKGIYVVCLASRPYPERTYDGYWYGFTPEQASFLAESKQAYIMLCCGSPDRLLAFKREEWTPLLDGMNTTAERHWHVFVYWHCDGVELDLPTQGRRLPVSEHRVVAGANS